MQLKVRNPHSVIIAHPSVNLIFCVTQNIGSTSSLLNYVKTSEHESFIVLTESGILHQMAKDAPGKELIRVHPKPMCM